MKERLTGAIILVVLIVLLVPELLSGPSRSAPAQQAATIATPSSSEEVPLRSYTIDLGDGARPSSAGANTSPQASGPAQPSTIVESAPQSAAPDQQAMPGGQGSAQTPPLPQGNGAPTGPDAGNGHSRSGTGQGGTGVGQSMPPSGASPPTTATPIPSSPRTAPPAAPTPTPRPSPSARAQAGESAQPPSRAPATSKAPSVADRKHAEAEQRRLAERTDEMKGATPPLNPPKSKPTADQKNERGPPPLKPPGGWMVQLGVFAKKDNAERLVHELRDKGIHVQVSESTSSGRPMWWVRTAAVADHGAADQLNARLKAAGHGGSVVPKQ